MSAFASLKEIGLILFGPRKPASQPAPLPETRDSIDRTLKAQIEFFASRADLGKLLVRVETIERRMWSKSQSSTLYCSFCGKSQHEVSKLIAGPAAFICDECVGFCTNIISEENAR